MVRVTFYYKPGCWLCDAAQETLNGITERYGLRVRKIDISGSEELYDLYRFDIPVLEFPDGTVLRGEIKRKALLNAIHGNRE